MSTPLSQRVTYSMEEFVERYQQLRQSHGDWTHRRIADEMKMSEGGVSKALERARRRGYDIPPTRGTLTPKEPVPLSLRKSVARSVEDVTPRSGWNRDAACRFAGMFDDRFVPDGRVRSNSRVVQAVKDEFCAICPVKPECLVTGLKDPLLQGIWGGVLLPHQLDEVDVDKLKAEIDERR